MKRFKKSEYIGKRYQNNDGEWMTVVEYHRTDNVIVEFDTSKNRKKSQMSHIKRGSVKDLVYIKSQKRTREEYNQDRIEAKANEYAGQRFMNNEGQEYIVLEYSGKYNVKIKFTESGSVQTTSSSRFKDGAILDDTRRQEFSSGGGRNKATYEELKATAVAKVGNIYTNKRGYEFSVIQVSEDLASFLIEFSLTRYQLWTSPVNIKDNAGVKDVYMRDVQGIGYLGLVNKNVAYYEKALNLWQGMIRRCYDVNHRPNAKYTKAQVSERWSCFQFFLEDLPKLTGFNRWLGEPMHLDKDLVGDSLMYDVSTCIFLTPQENREEQKVRYTK